MRKWLERILGLEKRIAAAKEQWLDEWLRRGLARVVTDGGRVAWLGRVATVTLGSEKWAVDIRFRRLSK